MNIDINKIIQNSIPYAFAVLIAYILASAIYVYLPKSGVEYIQDETKTLEYRKYDGFYNQVTKKEVKKAQKKTAKKQETLDKYILKAIYSTTKNGGWITIENKRGNKSYILSQYDELDGYILTKLYKNYVIFEKSAKEYKLEIKSKNKNLKYQVERKLDNNQSESVIVENDTVTVKREYLNSYVNDIEKVWKNIAINEIRKNGKIDGFKVGFVNKNSVFGKLGLKKGDIIKSINNNVLSSYADAFKVYNNINTTKYLNIEILRNNEMMELNYEID